MPELRKYEYLRTISVEEIFKDRNRLTNRCKELEQGLRKLEWCGTDNYDYGLGYCPGCGKERREKDDNHEPNCWLEKLLEGGK